MEERAYERTHPWIRFPPGFRAGHAAVVVAARSGGGSLRAGRARGPASRCRGRDAQALPGQGRPSDHGHRGEHAYRSAGAPPARRATRTADLTGVPRPGSRQHSGSVRGHLPPGRGWRISPPFPGLDSRGKPHRPRGIGGTPGGGSRPGGDTRVLRRGGEIRGRPAGGLPVSARTAVRLAGGGRDLAGSRGALGERSRGGRSCVRSSRTCTSLGSIPSAMGNGRTARLAEFHHPGARRRFPSPATHLLSNHYNLTRADYYRQLDRSSRASDGRGGRARVHRPIRCVVSWTALRSSAVTSKRCNPG